MLVSAGAPASLLAQDGQVELRHQRPECIQRAHWHLWIKIYSCHESAYMHVTHVVYMHEDMMTLLICHEVHVTHVACMHDHVMNLLTCHVVHATHVACMHEDVMEQCRMCRTQSRHSAA